MPNHSLQRKDPWGAPPHIASGRLNVYAGVNADRKSRFEARSVRRLGNWFVLEVPTPLLWMDNGYSRSLYDECEFEWPTVIELWP